MSQANDSAAESGIPIRPDVRESIDTLRRHYDDLARVHGYSAAATQWSSVATQEQRLRILAQIGDVRESSVLDFGCGTGHLLRVLEQEFQFRGTYTGFDISEEALSLARTHNPRGRFECRDIWADGGGGDFDYIFISGVFNNRVADNVAFMEETLKRLFPRARRGLAFNALSTYVDHMADGLFYADPERVFAFCKTELSPAVTLRHDYEIKEDIVPFEFTVYVRQTGHYPRRKIVRPV